MRSTVLNRLEPTVPLNVLVIQSGECRAAGLTKVSGCEKIRACPRFTGIPAECGPVAQLGARFHGMEEVVGSIPTRSTIKSTTYRYPPLQFGVIWCQNAFLSC